MRRIDRANAERLAWPAAVAGLTLICLAPSCWAPFWPIADRARLLLNASYQGLGLSQLRWIFASFHPGRLYEPMSWLSYAVDDDLWGTSPAGFHVQSLALHAANAVLLYLIGARLLKDRAWAAAAALIFSLHPMRVEAVSWLSARPYLLSSFFALLCVQLHLRGVDDRRGRDRWLAASLAAFGLALAAHPFAAGIPAVLLLIDWKLGRLGGERETVWKETTGYWLLLYVFAAISAAARDIGGPASGAAVLSPAAELGRAVCAPVEALMRTLWPFRLFPILPQPPAPTLLRVLVDGLLAAGATFELVRRRRRGALASWLAFLALLTPYALLDPDGITSQALRFGDRWTYLPSAALALGLAAALREGSGRLPDVRLRNGAYFGIAAALLLGPPAFLNARAWTAPDALLARNLRAEPACTECAAVLVESARARGDDAEAGRLSVLQRDADIGALKARGDWQTLLARGTEAANRGAVDDSLAFLLAGISVSSQNAATHYETGYVYTLKRDFDRAAEESQAALALDPSMVYAHVNLGFALQQKGQEREAIAQFQDALKLDPKNELARNNLESAVQILARKGGGDWKSLLDSGNEALARGALDEGMAFLRASLALNANNAAAYFDIGYAYSLKGDIDNALAQTQEAVRLDPKMIFARNNLGFFLEKKGRYREAADQFRAALALDPGNQLARNNLAAVNSVLDLLKHGSAQALYQQAIAYVDGGALDEALTFLLASVAADPQNANTHFETGFVYGLKGDLDHDIEQLKVALALDPSIVLAHNNLGFAYVQKGLYNEAVAQFQEALRLSPTNELARDNLTIMLVKAAARK